MITHRSIYQISKDNVFGSVNSYRELNDAIKKYGETFGYDFNDKKFRGYSQEVKIMKESDIIKDIKNGADYRTDSTTPVKIGNRNGGEYIHSIPNNSVIDNIQNLPKY